MKTLTTTRGFEYDLEIVSINQGRLLTVMATCENDEKLFEFDFETKFGDITDDNANEFMNDADLTEIETWVDMTESSWVVSEMQKICIRKGNVSFDVNNIGLFLVNVSYWMGDKCTDLKTMYTLQEMNDFINENK